MKKLLLIGLVAGVMAFVPVQRSDARYIGRNWVRVSGLLWILPVWILQSVSLFLLPTLSVLWLLSAIPLVRRQPLLSSPPTSQLLSAVRS